jgi:hypothetical protein
MHRAGLLAVLLLAVAVLAGSATLTCTETYEYRYNTTDKIQVGFEFESIAPVFPNRSIELTRNLIYTLAHSAMWNKPLEFNVTLEYYAPNQIWRIIKYRCIYNDGSYEWVLYYDVVAQTPERKTATITFTVPATATQYRGSTSIPVSKPLSGIYCAALPTVESWPYCPAFKAEDNKLVSVDTPEWNALQVNGRKPGDVVEAYGVNAAIPDPWRYGIRSDVGTLSYVEIDGIRYDPDAANVPVRSSVYLHMVGMPTQWGTVKSRGVSEVPIYVVKFVISVSDPPTAFCRPPSCIILVWYNLTEVALSCNILGSHLYNALVAVPSGFKMWELNLIRDMSEIRLPLGSVYLATIDVIWLSDNYGLISIYRVNRFDGSPGTPYLRVIKNATYYEDVASRGKINGPLTISDPDWSPRRTNVAVAVDHSAPSIEFSLYVWPVPVLWDYSPVVNRGAYSFYCRDQKGSRVVVRLNASIWLTDALRINHPDISGGRYVDLLHLLKGEPAVYYWGQGDQYGAVVVHTERRYENTTADSAGLVKLNHTTGIAPTDVAVLDISWSAPQLAGGGSGGGGVSPWLVALVPTMACRSMFCTSLSPEVLGPLPPTTGDRALPNMGYSIMLMHIGPSSRHRVKVYVEDGYVITSRQSINVTRVKNYKLVEIDKEWRPLEAVVVGPGWWVPIRPLNHCSSMPVNASSIYATPDRLGPVKITVEDNGASSTYVFYVTNDVGYRITTRTPAPASITAAPFNMTAYVTLDGIPYYHHIYGFGEGGRLSPPTCLSTWYNNTLMSQLALSGDFWGSFGLANTPMRPVQIQYSYSKPRLELVDPWRGLVKVRADGPVSGFAFYAQRGGTWVKIGEAGGRCILVNASRVFPWDPVLVLPLVEQKLDAAPGSTVAIWRPETALLFKTWADVVGYPKGARSVLEVVRTC